MQSWLHNDRRIKQIRLLSRIMSVTDISANLRIPKSEITRVLKEHTAKRRNNNEAETKGQKEDSQITT